MSSQRAVAVTFGWMTRARRTPRVLLLPRGAHELGRPQRGRGGVARVVDPDAPAGVDERERFHPAGVAQRANELEERARPVHVGLKRPELRPDVGGHAHELEARRGLDQGHRRRDVLATHAELRRVVPGRDVRVRRACELQARVDPHAHPRLAAGRARPGFDARHLLDALDLDGADAAICARDRRVELAVLLGDPAVDDAFGRDAAAERDEELRAADDVRSASLGGEGTYDGPCRVCFDGVGDEMLGPVEGGAERARLGRDTVEVVHVRRRASLRGDRFERRAAQSENAICSAQGGHRASQSSPGMLRKPERETAQTAREARASKKLSTLRSIDYPCALLMSALRRAKVVCTLGPACDSLDGLRRLISAGMDVARLNFSHGTHEEHGARLGRLREASQLERKSVAALQDLCGPKIRTGTFPRKFDLPTGADVTLIEGDSSADERVVAIQYEGLAGDVRLGDRILFDDGRLVLAVVAVDGQRVKARVEQGGGMRDHVGVHLPSKTMRISALTEKDKQDLVFGLSNGVDYIAMSFVRRAEDILQIREICNAWGAPTPVIAKIETPDAV